VLTLWPSAKPRGYWTVRRGRRFGYVFSNGLPTRTVRHSLGDFGSPFSFFHQSPITLRRANACSGQASHFPVRHSPASAGRRRITAALAAAFRVASHLNQIVATEVQTVGITISQCKSPRSVRDFGENNAGRSRPVSVLLTLGLSSRAKPGLKQPESGLLLINTVSIID